MVIYATSKALAEKAAWDFIAKEKPQFSLVTVNPAWVTGASQDPALKKLSNLRSSHAVTAQNLFDVKDFPQKPTVSRLTGDCWRFLLRSRSMIIHAHCAVVFVRASSTSKMWLNATTVRQRSQIQKLARTASKIQWCHAVQTRYFECAD